MSINNLEFTSFNYLTNLASVNANEVNTDILTKTDPDISNLQFDMLEGINTNETIQEQIDNITVDITAAEADIVVLQGQMTTANSNISTLQGQMTTANSNISTLQSEMNDAQSDINTLQSEMNDAQSDINTLQSEMNTAQGDINTLQSEMNDAQSDINTLQSEMNTAQGDINDLQADVIALGVSTGVTAATVAGLVISQAAQDVTLATHTTQIGVLQGEMNTAQTDITALQVKTTTQSFSAFSGTTFSGRLNIGSTIAGVTLEQTTASTFGSGITASAAISTTSTLTSTAGTSQMDSLLVNNNFEVTNDAFITAGELYITRTLLTSQKKLVLYDNGTGNDYDYLGFWTDSGAGSRKFLNCEIDGDSNSAFQWFNGNGLGTSRTLMKKLNPTIEETFCGSSRFVKLAGFTQQIDLTRILANDQVIINLMGDTAGVNTFDGQIIQDKGNSLDDNRGTMTIQSGGIAINALNTGVNIQATSSALIQSGTTLTLTSGTETEINCAALDINASNNITIDTPSTTILTSEGITLECPLTSINGIIIKTNETANDIDITTIGVSSDINLLSTAATINLTAATECDITCATLDLNASTIATLDSPIITLTSTGKLTLGSGAAETEINCGVLDINATGALTIDALTSVLTATDIDIIATGTNVDILANVDINLTSTTGAIKLNSASTCSSTLGVTGLSTFTGGFTSSAESNMNHNFLIQQSTYPPASTSALGYTDRETTTTNPMTNALIERSNIVLPSKGVWLIICGYEFSSNALSANTITFKQIVLSTTSGGSTPAAGGLQYLERIDDAVSVVENRQQGTLSGVFIATAATTIFVNARSTVGSSTNTKLVTNVSMTRIG